ncbi:hypothetical protein DEO72_LG4g872 [Vigna unguiculata]|uniref:Secreted protein n=1 Tax=Vigna unguiculata TaxID=3917 RepID=A0A4D6LN06_VIGUN|nr:hypothetical protein DEO72_LG4g872 [Vigna unguiculata]
MNWYVLVCVLSLWCIVCVRESVPEPAILALASKARLGEIYRDSYPFVCSRLSLRRRMFGLDERSSRLGDERVSRSGESLSPKREREECFDGSLTRSPGERLDSWAKCNLVQASVTHLSESSRMVMCVPRIGDKHVAFYGLWPGMTSLKLWHGIADEHEEPLSCGSGCMVFARSLSVVADRCSSRAP